MERKTSTETLFFFHFGKSQTLLIYCVFLWSRKKKENTLSLVDKLVKENIVHPSFGSPVCEYIMADEGRVK